MTSVSACEQQAFLIKEFCKRNRISLATYHKIKKEGRGPREMSLGRAIRISIEAERDWRAAREMPDDTEARLIKREAEARSRLSRHAGARAAASKRHVSKRHARVEEEER
jgi:hypothetical protein